jgi:Flp pilus assembly protein TadG
MNTIRHLLTQRLGQSMVEFALLAPAFFLLLIGVLDFGRAGFYYVSSADLARQTARYAAAYNNGTGFTSAQIDQYIKGQANATAINTPTLMNPAVCAKPNGPPVLACQRPGVGQANYWVVKCLIPTCNPETVTVAVIYAFEPTTPMINSLTGIIYIYADSKMSKEYIG